MTVLRYAFVDGAATLTLSAPERGSALDRQLGEELLAADRPAEPQHGS